MTTTPERWTQGTNPYDWVDGDEDPRQAFAHPVGEKETLANYLRHYRLTLVMKCEGLDAEQMARRSVPPSTMSLLGLVRHMAQVENHWFERILKQQPDVQQIYDTPEHSDADFNGAVADPAVVDEAWATWRDRVASADAWLDAFPEEDLGTTVPRRDEQLPVRDVLVHMIEEYARHLGHADLLREAIDGRVGQ
ncbi:DinB family protein [Myceligenerans pegani]|uniref:DinB family protein n=1 Tax=Myceligenerans pegani TaxID=2776917 RepID=A0ABR9N1M3_9MICO|nr:DinB family protein [Myceligenerans sp. TRM 65318]MBE1877561.1 DinB family protein [Myceligenerans sp. TRM 65318]MBE3019832.1 DinB family protein [Myceligenerans sp. TRM 65318]